MERVLRSVAFSAVVLVVPSMASAQGDPQGPEFRVNTYTTNQQRFPSVAANSSGNFVVVWHSYLQDGGLDGIFGQRYAVSGAPLGPEFRVNTSTTANQYVADVASDSSGNFVVVWTDSARDGSAGGIFGQRYSASGAPLGAEFRVNTYTTNEQGFSSIASDSAGNFVVVWDSLLQDGAEEGIFGQRYAASGAPLGPEFRVNTYTTDFQNRPAVTSNASGNFVVVWVSAQQDGSVRGIFGQRYAASGVPLGPEFRVNTYTTNHQRGQDVALDASGNFVVVWGSYTQDGFNYGVFGQRYAASGAPLGPEFRVNTHTTGTQLRPAVTSDASGNFVVVWRSYGQDGSNYGVFGQRYAASGAPLGPEFRVNTHTTNSQFRPAVASDGSGDFVVVWASNAQDGSAYGVFGQRYNMILPVELMDFGIE
jgi:hypothetical protein